MQGILYKERNSLQAPDFELKKTKQKIIQTTVLIFLSLLIEKCQTALFLIQSKKQLFSFHFQYFFSTPNSSNKTIIRHKQKEKKKEMFNFQRFNVKTKTIIHIEDSYMRA